MSQLTTQEVTYRDYPIQYFSSQSIGIKGIDVDIYESMLSNLLRERPKKLFYPLMSLEIDWSSVWPHFEIKTETSLAEELTTISEEDIAMEMVDHDLVVKMLPKKKYKIEVHIRSVRKGDPRLVEPDDFLFIE